MKSFIYNDPVKGTVTFLSARQGIPERYKGLGLNIWRNIIKQSSPAEICGSIDSSVVFEAKKAFHQELEQKYCDGEISIYPAEKEFEELFEKSYKRNDCNLKEFIPSIRFLMVLENGEVFGAFVFYQIRKANKKGTAIRIYPAPAFGDMGMSRRSEWHGFMARFLKWGLTHRFELLNGKKVKLAAWHFSVDDPNHRWDWPYRKKFERLVRREGLQISYEKVDGKNYIKRIRLNLKHSKRFKLWR